MLTGHAMRRIAIAVVVSPLLVVIVLPVWGATINLFQKVAIADSLLMDFRLSVGILMVVYFGMVLIQVPGYLLLLRYCSPVPVWASALLGVFVVSLTALIFQVDRVSAFLVGLELTGALIGGVFGIVAQSKESRQSSN